MDFESIYKYTSNLNDNLIAYYLQNDTDVGIFYRASELITSIRERSLRCKKYREVVGKWMNGGSTIELRDLLYPIGYNENIINDFNAFDLLDSVKCCKLK